MRRLYRPRADGSFSSPLGGFSGRGVKNYRGKTQRKNRSNSPSKRLHSHRISGEYWRAKQTPYPSATPRETSTCRRGSRRPRAAARREVYPPRARPAGSAVTAPRINNARGFNRAATVCPVTLISSVVQDKNKSKKKKNVNAPPTTNSTAWTHRRSSSARSSGTASVFQFVNGFVQCPSSSVDRYRRVSRGPLVGPSGVSSKTEGPRRDADDNAVAAAGRQTPRRSPVHLVVTPCPPSITPCTATGTRPAGKRGRVNCAARVWRFSPLSRWGGAYVENRSERPSEFTPVVRTAANPKTKKNVQRVGSDLLEVVSRI